MSHEIYMVEALKLAQLAADEGEVPVGAVLVCQNEIVGRGRNNKENQQNPMGHAELQAIAEAAKNLGRWRLADCQLYVTLEPCAMCAGAILSARLQSLIVGCRDPKAGATHSLFQLLTDPRLNHQVELTEGILAAESSQLLKKFFQQIRQRNKVLSHI